MLPAQGAIAQLVARLVRIEKVRGSIPLSSTKDSTIELLTVELGSHPSAAAASSLIQGSHFRAGQHFNDPRLFGGFQDRNTFLLVEEEALKPRLIEVATECVRGLLVGIGAPLKYVESAPYYCLVISTACVQAGLLVFEMTEG